MIHWKENSKVSSFTIPTLAQVSDLIVNEYIRQMQYLIFKMISSNHLLNYITSIYNFAYNIIKSHIITNKPHQVGLIFVLLYLILLYLEFVCGDNLWNSNFISPESTLWIEKLKKRLNGMEYNEKVPPLQCHSFANRLDNRWITVEQLSIKIAQPFLRDPPIWCVANINVIIIIALWLLLIMNTVAAEGIELQQIESENPYRFAGDHDSI